MKVLALASVAALALRVSILLCKVVSAPVARVVSAVMGVLRLASAAARVVASALMLFCRVVSAAARAVASASMLAWIGRAAGRRSVLSVVAADLRAEDCAASC